VRDSRQQTLKTQNPKPLVLDKTQDSHKGQKGQNEVTKEIRTDRFSTPPYFLESLKTFATSSDLCDLRETL